jgi:hypothetical protein
MSVIHWVLLLAEMQSGKTDTFLFVAAEMLRERKVKKVIIICGNNELDLKRQLEKDKKKFVKKYERYLEEELHKSLDERDDILEEIDIEKNVELRSGSDLNSKYDDTSIQGIKDTLIIWEESHFASGKKNRPNKFIERMGLHADDNPQCLENERNNFILSVSATPYAEISDYKHENQHKEIVKLKPGETYRGVGYYLRNEKIIGFKRWVQELPTILRKYIDGRPRYAVVRVNGDTNMDEAKKIATENGWEYKVFDAEQVAIAKKTHNSSMMNSMDELEDEPDKNTIIFIRGMCRMGKVVPKSHISFVMETASKPNTDTILQGLLGRMCGYNQCDIDIYIHNDILTKKTGNGTTELEKFVQLMENYDEEVHCIPRNAMHCVKNKRISNDWNIAKPIIITPDTHYEIEDVDDPDYEEYSKDQIIARVKSAFASNTFSHNNCENVESEINQQIITMENDNNTIVHQMCALDGSINGTFKNVPLLTQSQLSNPEQESRTFPGCGFGSNTSVQVIMFVVNTDCFEDLNFPRGTIILQARTREASEMMQLIKSIPKTTGQEAFTSKREDDTEVTGNGTCCLTIPSETSTSIESMKTSIDELIQISLLPREAVMMSRAITSNQCADNTWQGILVNNGVLRALKSGGEIYQYIKDKFQVKLKVKAKSGRPSSTIGPSLTRLATIAW